MANKTMKSNVFHRRLGYKYPVINHGRGIYLYDENGKEYIDGSGGPTVVNIGHGVKEIAEKIKVLAARFSYLYGSQFTTKDMESYAKELCALTPKGLNKVFFVSGGSEGVETAIKMARQYHYDSGSKGKYKIISRFPAFHGSTIMALSISSKPWMKKPFLPLLSRFPTVPAPYCYRCPFKESYPECGLKCAWALEEAIKKAGPETVSAFIAEPVIGSTVPAVVPPQEYFSIIRKICDKYNVLLIMDEVMSGFGRTGKWFACQHWNLVPDIIVVSKGISGGFVPLAAVFCQEKIFEAIKNGTGNLMHGFTFSNNPYTTGIGRAVLKYIKKRNLVKQSELMGKYLLTKLDSLLEIDIVGDVRGLGLMAGVELVQDKKTKKSFPRKKQIAEKVIQAAFKKGLNLLFGLGFTKEGDGDAILVAPPFIITKKEIDKIVKILRESILEAQNSL